MTSQTAIITGTASGIGRNFAHTIRDRFRLTVADIQLLARGRDFGNMLRLSWRLKGQMLTILSILWMFRPLLLLGPSGLKDMGRKLTSRWKPLLDLFSRK